LAVVTNNRLHRHTGVGPRVRALPPGASLAGLLSIIVGAWAAICVYVGPYFAFRPTTHSAWAWTTQNGYLHLLPGAVAVAAGLMLLPARRRGATSLPGLLLIAAGAWLVIGPVAWAVIGSGQVWAAAGPNRELMYQALASLAPGILLAAAGGSALKSAVARTRIEEVGTDAVEAGGIDRVGVDTARSDRDRVGARAADRQLVDTRERDRTAVDNPRVDAAGEPSAMTPGVDPADRRI
jgi:hypothetical protein